MRLEMNSETGVKIGSERNIVPSMDTQVVYKELADQPLSEVTVFEQFEQNISQLEVLSKKMQFLMREVRYLMKL